MKRKILTILWLLAVFAVIGYSQATKVCSDKPSTTYIYVNGIWDTQDQADKLKTLLQDEFRFATSTTLSAPSLGDCVKFRLSYNQTQGKFKDTLQAIGQIGQEKAIRYSQSLEGLKNENDNVVSGVVLSLWRTVNNIGNELLNYASTSAVNYTQTQNDLNDLIKAIKEELKAGNKVVLVGHSQGNLFVNAAYDQMVKYEGAWQAQNGIRLPDNTKLAVLGVSVPSDHVADRTEIASRIGRQRYTTDCVDFVWTSFSGILPYNVRGNSTNGLLNEAACDYHLVLNAVQEVLGLLNPLSYFQKPDSQATVSLVQNANPSLVSRLASIGKEWVADKVFWGLLETGAPFRHHKLENYLTRGSPTGKQIMFDLLSVLPNLPGMQTGNNCLYCENFEYAQTDGWKYYLSEVPAKVSTGEIKLLGNALNIKSTSNSQILQTTSQFYGNFTAKVGFTHQGMGQSRIALVKGSNSPKVAELVIDSLSGGLNLYVYPNSSTVVFQNEKISASQYTFRRTVFSAEVDSNEVRLYLDGQLKVRQAMVNLTQLPDIGGYYLQLSSTEEGGVFSGKDNTLLIHNVEIKRLAAPPPPTLTPACSANPAVILAGQSTVFTGSYTGGTAPFTASWGGVVSGSGATATYATVASMPAGFGKATYTVTDSGNPKQVATANCQAQINAPAPTGPAALSQSSLASDPALVAYYRFEGNANDSKGSNHGASTGVAYTPGKFGQGAAFNNNGSINLGSWQIPTAFTISSWVYLNSVNSYSTLFSNYNGGPTGSRNVQWFASDGSGVFVYSNFQDPGVGSKSILKANVWNHLVITHNGSVVKHYLNGVLDSQGNASHTASSQTNFLGRRHDGQMPLNGAMDDVAIFGRELTATEIAGLYSNGATAPAQPTTQPLSNVSCVVSSASVQTGQQVTYTANWSGGSGFPGFNWSGYVSGTTRSITWTYSSPGTYTASVLVMDNGQQLSAACPAVTVTSATVTVYSNPLPTPPAGVYWTWNLSAWQWQGAAWVTQPVLTFYGVDYRFNHPAGYIEALKQIKALGASGPLDRCISEFQSALPYWPPYTVASPGPSAPTVSGYSWNNTPQNRIEFSGNFSGTGFVSGVSVYFCANNTATCYQHPAAGVVVNSSVSLSVYRVNLTTGYWQAEVRIPNGTGRGPAFYVQ